MSSTLSSAMPTPEPAAVIFKITLRPHGPTRVATFAQRPGWADLAARVAGLFDLPTARGGSIALAYTDSDGDEITMDTEPELAFYYAERDAAGGTGPMRFSVSAGGTHFRCGPSGPHRGGPHHRGPFGRHQVPPPPPPPGPMPEDRVNAPPPPPEGTAPPPPPTYDAHDHEYSHGYHHHHHHHHGAGPSDSSDAGSDSDGPARRGGRGGRRGGRRGGSRRHDHDHDGPARDREHGHERRQGREHGHDFPPWFGYGPFGGGFPFRGGRGRWRRGNFGFSHFPFAPPFAGGDFGMPSHQGEWPF